MNEMTWRHVLAWEQMHCAECSSPKLLRFLGRPHELRYHIASGVVFGLCGLVALLACLLGLWLQSPGCKVLQGGHGVASKEPVPPHPAAFRDGCRVQWGTTCSAALSVMLHMRGLEQTGANEQACCSQQAVSVQP